MKTVIILGCSWGCGEWKRGSAQDQLITHGGIAQYFREDGYNVINLSQYSGSNHCMLDPLYYFLRMNNHLEIDSIYWIQTDIARSLRDGYIHLTDYKHSNLTESIRSMYYDFYSNLNHRLKIRGHRAKMIGGLTDLYVNFEFENLDFLVPSWIKLINSDISSAHLVDPIGHEWLDKHYSKPSEILPFVEQALERYNYWRSAPELFWPDGDHPNKKAHRILYDHIRTIS